MEIGSLSGNRNLLIILLILLEIAGGVIYYLYVYTPMQVEIKEKQAEVEKKRREEREIELTKRLLNETKEEIERLKSEIARLEKFFPEEVFIPRVLVLVENLALATHVEIDSIRPKNSSRGRARKPTASAASRPAPATGSEEKKIAFDEKKEYKTAEVDFKVVGSFQNIYNFMNELTTFPKLVVVDRLSLQPASRTGEEAANEKEGGAETGREIEVGGYMDLNAELPLTFYIQKMETPIIAGQESEDE